MKQQGKTWTTADGSPTLMKYLPKRDILFEKLGQKIASEAVYLEQRLREAKNQFIDICKEAHRNALDKNSTKRFSFTTFDKEFKFEYDIEEGNVRIYRATKSNPGHKDYELVVLDFTRTEAQSKSDDAIKFTTVEDMVPTEENSFAKEPEERFPGGDMMDKRITESVENFDLKEEKIHFITQKDIKKNEFPDLFDGIKKTEITTESFVGGKEGDCSVDETGLTIQKD